MAFGFSSSINRVPVGKTAKKSTPKSVQDIINRAAASATGAGVPVGPAPYTPGSLGGVAYNNPVKSTPIQQTNTVSGSPVTGAGFAANVPTTYAAGSGMTGGGAPLNPNGTDPYSGWMSRFQPSAFQNTVYNDPAIVLNQMWHDLGLNTSAPGYSTLRSLNNADPMSLFLLTNPGAKTGDLNGEAYGNFLHSLYGSQMTPGGRTIDFNEALRNLRGVGNQSGLDPNAQSALYQQLSQGGAPQQFRTYYGLAQDAAKMSLPPAIASAFLDALARQGDTYESNQAQTTGSPTPFFQYASNPMR